MLHLGRYVDLQQLSQGELVQNPDLRKKRCADMHGDGSNKRQRRRNSTSDSSEVLGTGCQSHSGDVRTYGVLDIRKGLDQDGTTGTSEAVTQVIPQSPENYAGQDSDIWENLEQAGPCFTDWDLRPSAYTQDVISFSGGFDMFG